MDQRNLWCMKNVFNNNIKKMANLDSMEYFSMFPTIFRYFIMMVLYVLVFSNFTKPYIQFILYMVMFILNFFTIVFVVKDFFSTPMLMKSIYGLFMPNDPSEFNNPYTVFFVAIIVLTGLLFICSLAIILTVFAYGKKTTNDYKSYKMTPTNALFLSQFQMSYFQYIIYLAMFVYFLIFAYVTGPAKKMMFNIACIIFSLIIIFTSVFCMIVSVNFLKIKQYNKQLYE